MLARRCLLPIAAMVIAGGVCGCTRASTDTARGLPSEQVRNAEDVLAGLVPNDVADKFQLDLTAHTEQFIADCMATYGFTYQPKDPHSLVDIVTDTDFTSLDYARAYGFGVTTFPHFVQTQDPNATYLKSLDSNLLKSYGGQLPLCADTGAQKAKRQDGVAEAERRFSRTDELVQADPKYRTAQQKWTACAATTGYPEPSRLDLIRSFQTERDLIMNRIPVTSPTQNTDSLQSQEESADRDPSFQELRRQEHRAAVATFTCSQALDAVYHERYEALR
jgi:hypothetical protein